MPPPGYNPNIPSSMRERQPVPEGYDSNTRAYAIFFGYMLTCVGLTVYLVQKLSKSYLVLSKSQTARLPPRKYVLVFVALAAGSLLTTWYYMIQYFKTSYQVWLMWRSYWQLDPDKNHMGIWLKETSLFKEAWEVAIVGNARYWWTHQIFFFACALGLALEQKGIRRGIKHTWVLMILGQICAISFATNLFFLSLLVSPPEQPPPSGAQRSKWFGPWIISFIGIIASEYPAYLLADQHYWEGAHRFFLVLIIPHIALMVLPTLRAILPARFFNDDDPEFTDGIYKVLWGVTLFGGGLLFWKVTAAAYSYSGLYGMNGALFEHPAVSSVGFDVIFCWISWAMWWRIQREGVEGATWKDDKEEADWVGAGSGTTVTIGDGSAVRRR